ncbi:MAG: glycoside hydrolase family 3 protein [Flavobacteriaceae bacterium]
MASDYHEYEEARKRLTIREKIGQSFMPAAYINDAEEEISKLENCIAEYGIGGICFFHSRASAATNFEGPREVIYNENSLEVLKKLISRYQKAAKYPLLISIDAEWGLAMRIENTPQYPYALTLGAMQDQAELVFQVGRNIGLDCREAGIHWNFAPVVDINNDPNNPVIGYRSFGENPAKVTRYGTAFFKGLKSSGILSSAKHFPGHGDTSTDSHLGLPVIDKSKEELYSNELKPFIELSKQGIESVMVGHLAVPALSSGQIEASTISNAIINGFLRKELNFDGVVVSDALNMHAVSKNLQYKGELEWRAYSAGVDVLCYTLNVEEGINAIEKRGDKKLIEERFKRVWDLKKRAMRPPGPKDLTPSILRKSLMIRLAEESLSLVKGEENYLNFFRQSPFAGLTIGTERDKNFTKHINKVHPFECFNYPASISAELEELAGSKQLLLALYPPSMKPANNFGLSNTELKMIDKLCNQMEVVLYVFGNPYVLNCLPLEKFKSVWSVFQDFPEFEENAARHFLGKSETRGVLPVTIKTS